MTERVAAIDCGTNSIRLLVADLDPATGALTDLTRRMEIVRLGQGVDKTGRLAPEALERTFARCREYAGEIKALGVGPDKLRFVATSASRDAENREEFRAGVLEILGVEPEVITGDEEARLSFAGATRELAGGDKYETPYIVLDIGGGSTEFVLGAGGPEAAKSVDIGCVRLTERHFHDDPPTAAQVAAARADIDAAIDLAAQTVPLDRVRTLVGLAGSVTTVAGLALGLAEYDSAAIHHSRPTVDQVRDVAERLLTSTHDTRAAHPVIHPGRVDVIGAGALVLLTVMERLGVPDLVVSEHDILDGIAFNVADRLAD